MPYPEEATILARHGLWCRRSTPHEIRLDADGRRGRWALALRGQREALSVHNTREAAVQAGLGLVTGREAGAETRAPSREGTSPKEGSDG